MRKTKFILHNEGRELHKWNSRTEHDMSLVQTRVWKEGGDGRKRGETKNGEKGLDESRGTVRERGGGHQDGLMTKERDGDGEASMCI